MSVGGLSFTNQHSSHGLLNINTRKSVGSTVKDTHIEIVPSSLVSKPPKPEIILPTKYNLP